MEIDTATIGDLTVTGTFTGPGVISSVNAGTGINISGPSSDPIINIADTLVSPGTYELANVSVNQQGQLTAAVNGAVQHSSDLIGAGTTPDELSLAPQPAVLAGQNVIGGQLNANSKGIITSLNKWSVVGNNAYFAQVQNISDNIATTIIPNNLDSDYHNNIGGVSTVDGRFTAAIDGQYTIMASAIWAPEPLGWRELNIYAQQNAGTVFLPMGVNCDGSSCIRSLKQSVVATFWLNAGQQAYVECLQTSGKTLPAQKFIVGIKLDNN
jgi:hypothetical protein